MSCHAAAQKAVNVCVSPCNNWDSLRRRSDFIRLQQTGQKWVTPAFVVQCFVSKEEKQPLFGLTVTKKVGSAVVRNRIRRRLRAVIEAYCQENGQSIKGWEFVLIGRHEALTRPYDTLLKDLGWALRRLKQNTHAE
jgi:ribonuclease P protein component